VVNGGPQYFAFVLRWCFAFELNLKLRKRLICGAKGLDFKGFAKTPSGISRKITGFSAGVLG